MRQPIVSGQFYESDFNALDKQIRACFKGKMGPGEMPSEPEKSMSKVKGAIIPHAGYAYSGQCAAWVYKEIAESSKPDLFVVIGPNHSGKGANVAVSFEDWKTPLGVVQNHKRFARKLVDKLIMHDESAFGDEHSVEVQLPFLQFVSAKKFSLQFVPMLVRDISFDECQKIADSIERVADDLGLKIAVIASSDFTHYGSAYGYLPFIENLKENMYGHDASAIQHIQKMDSKAFYNHVKEHGMTICGYQAATIAMEVSKLIFSTKAKLLTYYTSGDITGSYKSAVGYAGIVFE